jgi:hypothetical protein
MVHAVEENETGSEIQLARARVSDWVQESKALGPRRRRKTALSWCCRLAVEQPRRRRASCQVCHCPCRAEAKGKKISVGAIAIVPFDDADVSSMAFVTQTRSLVMAISSANVGAPCGTVV